MKDMELFLKNLTPSCSDGANVDTEIPEEVRHLLDELYELDELSAEDWREIYIALLKRLPNLHDRWQVLAVIYRVIELRSNFITANAIVAKLLKNFNLLFEKLPGKPAYFVPSSAGRWLFESLINPLDKAEVQAEAERYITATQQLSLVHFLAHRGVRA